MALEALEALRAPKALGTICRCTHSKRDGAYLIENHGATHLIWATQDFLELHTTSQSRRPLQDKHVFEVWPRCHLEHGRVPLLPTGPPFVENICAGPELTSKNGQVIRYTAFDTVLFASHPDMHGLRPSSIPLPA
ncbi:hypothetical protein FRC12_008354 [Ceratobasidium sp. 428]|nr:hypothetical protein FRC12_008354 [Ceratobasidium sp. 428]